MSLESRLHSEVCKKHFNFLFRNLQEDLITDKIKLAPERRMVERMKREERRQGEERGRLEKERIREWNKFPKEEKTPQHLTLSRQSDTHPLKEKQARGIHCWLSGSVLVESTVDSG